MFSDKDYLRFLACFDFLVGNGFLLDVLLCVFAKKLQVESASAFIREKVGKRTILSKPGREEIQGERIMCLTMGFYYLGSIMSLRLKSYIEAKNEGKTRTKKSAGQGVGLA